MNLTDWSPSGDHLLFDVGGDIYTLDLRTNTSRLLAGEPVDQYGAVYSPDGSRIFYVSYEASGIAPEIWTALMVVIAAVLGIAMIVLRSDIAFALVIVWALVGIAVARAGMQAIVIAAGLSALAVVIAIAWMLVRKRAE